MIAGLIVIRSAPANRSGVLENLIAKRYPEFVTLGKFLRQVSKRISRTDSMADRSRRILIVDDDQDIRANLTDILSDVGFETETAENGPIAVEKMARSNSDGNRAFDLCLLDFRMPGMDGIELAGKLRASDPELPVILITAHIGSDGIQRVVGPGSWKVLGKPIDVRQLLGLIDEFVA